MLQLRRDGTRVGSVRAGSSEELLQRTSGTSPISDESTLTSMSRFVQCQQPGHLARVGRPDVALTLNPLADPGLRRTALVPRPRRSPSLLKTPKSRAPAALANSASSFHPRLFSFAPSHLTLLPRPVYDESARLSCACKNAWHCISEALLLHRCCGQESKQGLAPRQSDSRAAKTSHLIAIAYSWAKISRPHARCPSPLALPLVRLSLVPGSWTGDARLLQASRPLHQTLSRPSRALRSLSQPSTDSDRPRRPEQAPRPGRA